MKIVSLLVALSLTVLASSASAQMNGQTTCVAAGGLLMDKPACDKLAATQKDLATCQIDRDNALNKNCPPSAPRPVTHTKAVCERNPVGPDSFDAGRIRQLNDDRCVCDDARYAVVDSPGYKHYRCVVVAEPVITQCQVEANVANTNGQLSDAELARVREILAQTSGRTIVTWDELTAALAEVKSILGAHGLALAALKSDVSKLRNDVDQNTADIAELQKMQETSPISMKIDAGYEFDFRRLSGLYHAPYAGARLTVNETKNGIFFASLDGRGSYGSSERNGASYAWQLSIAPGVCFTRACKVALELGPYYRGYAADKVSALQGENGLLTSEGRGWSLGAFTHLDVHLTDLIGINAEWRVGSGIDNAVYPRGNVYASKRDTVLQTGGSIGLTLHLF